jgi:hypothetical protein
MGAGYEWRYGEVRNTKPRDSIHKQIGPNYAAKMAGHHRACPWLEQQASANSSLELDWNLNLRAVFFFEASLTRWEQRIAEGKWGVVAHLDVRTICAADAELESCAT